MVHSDNKKKRGVQYKLIHQALQTMPSAFFFVLLLSVQIGVQPFLQQKFVATDIYVPSVVLIQEVRNNDELILSVLLDHSNIQTSL